MMRFNNPFANVSVAAPCPADWNAMIGGDRVRFCGQCQLSVYNLSAMSKDEAESLIARTEGRLCVRFYRRRDGSILTDNCPVGVRALKRGALRIKRAIASSVLGFLAGVAANAAVNRFGNYLLDRPDPLIYGAADPAPFRRVTMGQIARPALQEPRAEMGKYLAIQRPTSGPKTKHLRRH